MVVGRGHFDDVHGYQVDATQPTNDRLRLEG